MVVIVYVQYRFAHLISAVATPPKSLLFPCTPQPTLPCFPPYICVALVPKDHERNRIEKGWLAVEQHHALPRVGPVSKHLQSAHQDHC